MMHQDHPPPHEVNEYNGSRAADQASQVTTIMMPKANTVKPPLLVLNALERTRQRQLDLWDHALHLICAKIG
jgi:hypothetical protein